MRAVFSPSEARGTVSAVPSKSHAHRLLIAAALADAPCRVVCPVTSRDIEATVGCLNALGASVTRAVDGYDVVPADRGALPETALLDCGESGSTLRFLLPVACALGEKSTFTGGGRLPSRPIAELAKTLREGGIRLSADSLPLTTEGTLSGNVFRVNAAVSSQYVSGMLFALAATGRECTLCTEGEAVSRGYTEMTLDALALFGKKIECRDGAYLIPAGALRPPSEVRAEGDWSNAAFMLAAGALTGDVTVTGLSQISTQRDRLITDVLARMGAAVTAENGRCRVSESPLHGVSVDITDTPDMAPVLSVLMAQAKGESVMTGVGRLKDKESDRLAAIMHNLSAMGVSSSAEGDSLVIRGGGIKPFEAKGFNDHRMVMSAAVAGIAAGGSTDDAEAVEKSYPGFFDDLKQLGGAVYETI